MKGISRRTRTCAALAATGVVALAGASMAQAQTRPASVGDGVPTGQGGVQLFNYGGWINNAGGQGAAPPVEATAVSASCLADTDPLRRTTARTTTACRTERLDALFAFLKRKGANNVELFGHAGFPSNADTAGLTAYRALLDKHGLHAGGWHGDMSEAKLGCAPGRVEDPRPRLHRLGRLPEPGHRRARTTATTTRCARSRPSTASASAPSRPASVPCTSTITSRSSATATWTTASSRRRGRSSWSGWTRAT